MRAKKRVLKESIARRVTVLAPLHSGSGERRAVPVMREAVWNLRTELEETGLRNDEEVRVKDRDNRFGDEERHPKEGAG